MKKSSEEKKEIFSFPLLQVFLGILGVLIIIVSVNAINIIGKETKSKIMLGGDINNKSVDSTKTIELHAFPRHVLLFFNAKETKIPLIDIFDTKKMKPQKNSNLLSSILSDHVKEINNDNLDIVIYLEENANNAIFILRQIFIMLGIEHFDLVVLSDAESAVE